MNNLYIKIENGAPVGHPITESNLRLVDKSFDSESLDGRYMRFVRSEVTESAGVYEVSESKYEIVGGVVLESYVVRQMTLQEKTSKQNAEKSRWVENGGPASWVFDEATCSFLPPVAYPSDGGKYRWDESTTAWVLNDA